MKFHKLLLAAVTASAAHGVKCNPQE